MTHPQKGQSKTYFRITVVEPGWDGDVHLPGNLGLLRVVARAYPGADISYVGGQAQIDLMKVMVTPDIINRVKFIAWPVYLDKDTLPTDVYRSLARIRALPRQAWDQADLIVMCSATATMLSAINWAGLASRTCIMLHGNANELSGWRSRNPFRRAFDLTGSLRRFSRNGGRVMVLEERIREQMSRDYKWLASSLVVMPHPLLAEEAERLDARRQLTLPIKIGFAGRASAAKGFPDFLEFAREAHHLRPGMFEFHAFGMLAPECEQLDQMPLSSRAHLSLSRRQYIDGLNSLHYIFAWHQDSYYENAASGVVYDAVNLGIPLIARSAAQISNWANHGIVIATSHQDLSSAIQWLAAMRIETETAQYAAQQGCLDTLRQSLSYTALAEKFQQLAKLTPL